MLSASFHNTFIPERVYLSEMLKFAAKSGSGNIEDISEATGIPTGKSSGKVEPILNYASGMGLIQVEKKSDGVKELSLTHLGRVIYLEDRNLSESYSQWLVHLHLCNPFSGASVWHYTFARAFPSYQNQLTRPQLEDYITQHIPGNPTRAVGPLLLMYLEAASFSNTQCLIKEEEKYSKSRLPVIQEYFTGYAALMFLYWDFINPNSQQMVRNEFEAVTHFFQLSGWDLQTIDEVLEAWALRNWIRLDRQTEKLVITRLVATESVIPKVFDELI